MFGNEQLDEIGEKYKWFVCQTHDLNVVGSNPISLIGFIYFLWFCLFFFLIMTFNVFEQFEITRLIPLNLFGLELSITNSTLFLFLTLAFIYFLYVTNIKNGFITPTRWQSVIEIMFDVINEMTKENIGKKGGIYFPFIFSLFLFILVLNLFGVVPYTFSPTAHIAITFGFSLSIFLGVVLLGIVNHGFNYFSMFMPAGSPLALAPFLIVIELISHTAKAISLGVRLAANITAGHILFSIFSGFVLTMLTAGGILSFVSIFPFLILLFVTVLELAVAFIQGYVFSLLTAIYISESEDLH